MADLGWIDFSKNDRNKVLNVLDLLSEAGTLDELGISPIRDGFANIFFPGTSTIQTKAKYFLCIPYAFKDLERSSETNLNQMYKSLIAKERSCGERLYNTNPNSEGVIGINAIKNGKWVKRQPSDIYWGGIRRLGIFVGGNRSISEYLRYLCVKNNKKVTLKSLGNRNDKAEEKECDDIDAGQDAYMRFWNLPTYKKNWLENITIDLTRDEALFLKNQVIKNCKDSMFASIIENDMKDFVDIKKFEDLGLGYINKFSEEIKADYYNAIAFSEFVYVLRILYNIIVFNGKNEDANSEWGKLYAKLDAIANIDIYAIYSRFKIDNHLLLHFLITAQEQMKLRDIEGLKETIIKREVHLKGVSRAKTQHPIEWMPNMWIGGKRLDYRFPDAQKIINDIFEGEKNCAESK